MPHAFMFMVFRVLPFYLFRICCSVFYHFRLSFPCSIFRICCSVFSLQPFRCSVFYYNPQSNGQLFLQDSDPSHTANRKANNAIYKLGAKKFSIPALKMCFTMKNILLVLKKLYYQYQLNI